MRQAKSEQNKTLKIIRTKKYGKGVFTTTPIQRNQTITTLGGEIISIEELVTRVNAGTLRIDDPLQIGRRKYIVLDDLSRTFNHSCEPNAGVRGTSELFALRDIVRDEEIT